MKESDGPLGQDLHDCFKKLDRQTLNPKKSDPVNPGILTKKS